MCSQPGRGSEELAASGGGGEEGVNRLGEDVTSTPGLSACMRSVMFFTAVLRPENENWQHILGYKMSTKH